MDTRTIIDPPSWEHIEDFGPGDTVTVRLRIREEERERVQAFKGTVIRGKFRKGIVPQPGASFIVRRIASGVGVERTIPLYSPNIESLKVDRRGKVRRARLYYLRKVFGKKARIKEKR